MFGLGGCSCGKMSGSFTFLLPMIISFLVSRCSENSNSNLASITSNLGLDLRQFKCTTAQSLGFLQRYKYINKNKNK